MGRDSLLLVLSLASARLFSFIARTFVVAFFPELMIRYSVGYTQVGTLYSAYFWVYLICMIPAGWLADRRSPRAMVVAGLVLMAVGHLAFAYSPSWEWATACRGLMGLGTALVFSPVFKLIIVHLAGHTRAKAFAWMEMSSSSGMLVGLAVLPMLAARTDLKTLGIGLFILTLISASSVALLRLPPPAISSGPTGLGSAGPHFFRNFTCLLLTIVLTNVGATSVYAWLPTDLRDGMGMSTIQASLVMGLILICSLVGAVITSRIIDRVGAYRIAISGMIAFGVGLLLLVPAKAQLAILGAPLMGVGTSMMFSCLGMMISTLNPARTGQVMGAISTGGQVGVAVAGVLFGWILDQTGTFASIWLVGIVSTVAALGTMALIRGDESQSTGRVA